MHCHSISESSLEDYDVFHDKLFPIKEANRVFCLRCIQPRVVTGVPAARNEIKYCRPERTKILPPGAN